jgi:superfamily II DNA or RNA helicase
MNKQPYANQSLMTSSRRSSPDETASHNSAPQSAKRRRSKKREATGGAGNEKRFRFGGNQGQVSLFNGRLKVEFVYSPDRVAAIKQIPQARFHGEEKMWTVPAGQYHLLQESRYFSREQLHYTFPEESLQESPAAGRERCEAAMARLRANPFSVPEADLELLEPDIVFRLAAKQGALRAFPKFRSKAKTLLEKLPRVHFLAAEKGYFFPVEELNGFLLKLRDAGLIFAVEEQASNCLSGGSEARARILRDPSGASAEDLSAALFGPVVTTFFGEDGSEYFSLTNYTTLQLRALFPAAKSYASRKTVAACFDEEELLRLLARSRSSGEKVWLSREVQEFLDRQKTRYERQVASATGGFDQALLAAVDVPLCWMLDSSGRALLLVSRTEYGNAFDKKRGNPFAKIPKEMAATGSDHYAFFIGDSVLLRRIAELHAFLNAPVPHTEEFGKHLQELEKRRALKERRDFYQALSDAPAEDIAAPETLTKALYPHQRVAVQWLLENPRAFLGDDMGLGKTLSVLTYFECLRLQERCDFLLVICPNSLCRNWRREAARWLPHRRLALLPDEKAEKIKFFKKMAWGGLLCDGLVLNYEAVRLDYVPEGLRPLLESKKILLCLDESQRVKSASSKTFQAISGIAPECSRRVFLSGTPTPKDISDIWAQMRLLDDGNRFGTNFYDWLSRVAELGNKYSEYAVKRFREEEVREVIVRVQELLLRRKKEDVLSLPEKTFLVRDIELSGEQLKRYEEVRKELLLRVSSTGGKTFVREIDNILEEYLRAVQIASNPRLVDENWKGEPAKFRELDSLLEEIVGERDEKVVVWTNYLGNVRELAARYAQYGAAQFSGEVSPQERERVVREFQEERTLRVLVAVPAAGGVGITLTAAQTAIYVDKTWNAEHWMQSVDRIHRIGQRGTVRIISLQACPVDELIARNLARKFRGQAALLGEGETRDESEAEFLPVGYPDRRELLEALEKA